MRERARAIPLAALVCALAVMGVLRACERRAVAPSTRPAPVVVSRASVDAGLRSIAIPSLREGADAAAPSAAPHVLHGDAHHTGRASALGPTHARVAWRSHIGAPIEAQVVASFDERTLYAAALDGTLTAIAASNGDRVWQVVLGDRAYSTPCVSASGTIYVGSDAKRFYAVTPGGIVAWKLETSGEADTGAVIAGDVVVFAAGASVYAVRPAGDVAWRFDAKKKVFTSPALGDGGTLVFGSQDHHVYALSPTGELAFSTDLGADVDGSPVIGDDGSITVGTDAGEIVRLTAKGEVVWRVQAGGYVRGALSLSRNGDALAGVYGPAPRVVRVSADGAVTGEFSVQGTGGREMGVHGGPLEDARGDLYFGAQDDDVHALGASGAWEWSFTTGGDVDAPLSLLSNGLLVAGSDDGFVYAFAPDAP